MGRERRRRVFEGVALERREKRWEKQKRWIGLDWIGVGENLRKISYTWMRLG
jgi:hypothetical protein